MVEEKRLRKDMEKLWIITVYDQKEAKAMATGHIKKNQKDWHTKVSFLLQLTGDNPFTFSHREMIFKSFKRGTGKLEWIQFGVNKVIRVLGSLTIGERLKELRLFGLGTIKLRGSK